MSPRHFIGTVSLAIAFLTFCFVLLGLIETDPFTRDAVNILYTILGVASCGLFIVFTILMFPPLTIKKLDKFYSLPYFLSFLWIVIIVNFAVTASSSLNQMPSDWREISVTTIVVWSIILLIALLASLIYHYRLELLKKVWQTIRKEKLSTTFKRIEFWRTEFVKTTKREKVEGPIVRFLDYAFSWLRILSPLDWYDYYCDKGKRHCGSKEREERFHHVERYVGGWVIFEIIVIIILAVVGSFEGKAWPYFLICSLFGIRVLEMWQSSLNSTIFNPLRGVNRKDDYGVISGRRFLILNLINFGELVVIFGVFAFIAKGAFDSYLDSISKSLHYSVSVATLLGTDIKPASPIGHTIFFFEIMFAFTYIILILGRAISLLPQLRSEK